LRKESCVTKCLTSREYIPQEDHAAQTRATWKQFVFGALDQPEKGLAPWRSQPRTLLWADTRVEGWRRPQPQVRELRIRVNP
jgi:hypothetical protein